MTVIAEPLKFPERLAPFQLMHVASMWAAPHRTCSTASRWVAPHGLHQRGSIVGGTSMDKHRLIYDGWQPR
ncbi:hypothetical protein [Lentilactobacillus parabuchneri]|uniref:hypothetical protein n=1 Tax=Lentilactobacillus parabuchneri TaxID=152331 RepID=UPI0031D3890B